MQRSEFNAVGTLMEHPADAYRLSDAQEAERQRMLGLIALLDQVYADERSEMELDSTEVQALVALMDSTYDRPATWISNLLCIGYDMCRPPSTGEGQGELRTLPYTPLLESGATAEPLLGAFPNPAGSWVAFDFDLLTVPKDAWLVVRDVTGRQVHALRLTTHQGQLVWDTRQITPGTYTVELTESSKRLCTTRLVIKP